MLIKQFRAIDSFAFEHNQRDSFGGGNILKRISIHHEQVCIVAGTNRPDSVVNPEQTSRVQSCSLQGHGWRDASLHPKLKLMLHSRSMDHEKVSRVAARDQ